MDLVTIFLIGAAYGVVMYFVRMAWEFDIFMQVWEEQNPHRYVYDVRQKWFERYRG